MKKKMRNLRFFGFDVQVLHHRSADVVDCVGGEFADEDIVVDGITYAAADDTDGERQGCYCCYEVL